MQRVPAILVGGVAKHEVERPRREGKYDRLLDGRAWMVRVPMARPGLLPTSEDVAWLRRQVRRRATLRGLRVAVMVLEDGRAAVQAIGDQAATTERQPRLKWVPGRKGRG